MDVVRREKIFDEVWKHGNFPKEQQPDEFTITEFIEEAARRGRELGRRTAYDKLMQLRKAGKLAGRQQSSGTWLLRWIEEEDED